MPSPLDHALLGQNIIQLLGLMDLPIERQQKIVALLTELVEKRTIIRIIEGMTEEDKTRAETIFTTGTDEAKGTFLQGVADLQKILAEEIVKAKQEILDDVGSLAQ